MMKSKIVGKPLVLIISCLGIEVVSLFMDSIEIASHCFSIKVSKSAIFKNVAANLRFYYNLKFEPI